MSDSRKPEAPIDLLEYRARKLAAEVADAALDTDNMYSHMQRVIAERAENVERMEAERRKHNRKTGREYKLPVTHNKPREDKT